MHIFDVDAKALIEKAAEELRNVKEVEPPAWAGFVKTGPHKEKVPDNPDWWYIRTASLLRRVALRPYGLSRLRRIYGGRKNRGFKPERKVSASGNIIRKALQQLEAAKLVKKTKKGREITSAGQKFLDNAAKKIEKHAA